MIIPLHQDAAFQQLIDDSADGRLAHSRNSRQFRAGNATNPHHRFDDATLVHSSQVGRSSHVVYDDAQR
jgi:hypothetical protein